MEKLSEKEISSLIWIEFVNSQEHSKFFDWLFANFNITQKMTMDESIDYNKQFNYSDDDSDTDDSDN